MCFKCDVFLCAFPVQCNYVKYQSFYLIFFVFQCVSMAYVTSIQKQQKLPFVTACVFQNEWSKTSWKNYPQRFMVVSLFSEGTCLITVKLKFKNKEFSQTPNTLSLFPCRTEYCKNSFFFYMSLMNGESVIQTLLAMVVIIYPAIHC